MKEVNNIKVVGVDHGFGNTKTASCCFRSGVTLCEKEPTFKANLLTYDGRYYLIGEDRKEFTPDKMRDDDYYVLTLAAIAEELKANNLTTAQVHIAAGLPLTWVSEQKDAFRKYLTRNYNIEFAFRGIEYRVTITGASVFPQGFSAIADKLRDFRNVNLLCDIGNGTMNTTCTFATESPTRSVAGRRNTASTSVCWLFVRRLCANSASLWTSPSLKT